VPPNHRRNFNRATDQHHFGGLPSFTDGNIGKSDLFEVTLCDQTLGEREYPLDGDSGKDRIEGRMAKHAVLCNKGDIHVRTLRDHATVIDEYTVICAVILGLHYD